MVNLVHLYLLASIFVAVVFVSKYNDDEIRMYSIFLEKEKAIEAIFRNLFFSTSIFITFKFLQFFNIKISRDIDYKEIFIDQFWVIIHFSSVSIESYKHDILIFVIYFELYSILLLIGYEIKDFPMMIDPPSIQKHQTILKAQTIVFVINVFLIHITFGHTNYLNLLIMLMIKSISLFASHIIYIIDRKNRGETRFYKDLSFILTSVFNILHLTLLPILYLKYALLINEITKIYNWYKARQALMTGLKVPSKEVTDDCLICRESLSQEDARVLPCGHVFHYSCIEHWIKSKPECPLCHAKILVSNYDLDGAIEKAEKIIANLKEINKTLKEKNAREAEEAELNR